MSEQYPPQPITETTEAVPTIIMDQGVGKRLDAGEVIDVNDVHLASLMEKVPGVDPSKVRLRLVGFYDKEYAISKPDEQGIVTITLPAKDTDKVLPTAISEYADSLAHRDLDNAVSEGLKDAGEFASSITNESGRVIGSAAIGAIPGLVLMESARDIGGHFSPGARRGRKLAKSVKNTPSFTVHKQGK